MHRILASAAVEYVSAYIPLPALSSSNCCVSIHNFNASYSMDDKNHYKYFLMAVWRLGMYRSLAIIICNKSMSNLYKLSTKITGGFTNRYIIIPLLLSSYA